MSNPGIKKSLVIRLVIKTGISCLLILLITALITFYIFLFTAYDKKDPIDKTDKIRICEWDYYDRNFSNLYMILTLYDLYSDDFDKYWEVVEAYQTYTIALEWSHAAENGREGADAKLSEALAKLSEQESSAKFPETQNTIKWLRNKLNVETGEG